MTTLLDAGERSALVRAASALVQGHALAIDRADTGQRLWYDVVTGNRIQTDGATLFRFYTDPAILSWMRTLTDCPSLTRSPHVRSAININCLRYAGQQYPWHRDAVAYTALLFLSSVPRAAEGAFLIRDADGELVSIQPRCGNLLVMDGTRCPHAVSALTKDALRLTMPMVYPANHVDRPAGLDDYLYGTDD